MEKFKYTILKNYYFIIHEVSDQVVKQKRQMENIHGIMLDNSPRLALYATNIKPKNGTRHSTEFFEESQTKINNFYRFMFMISKTYLHHNYISIN